MLTTALIALTVAAHEISPWITRCVPGPCAVVQTQALNFDPAARVELTVFRRATEVVVTALTPPLAVPSVVLVIDDALDVEMSTDACAEDHCRLTAVLDSARVRRLRRAEALQIVITPADQPTERLDFDPEGFDQAFLELPRDL